MTGPDLIGSTAGRVALAGIEDRRSVLFILSPRVIDFDTFLPTALQLKEEHPEWTFRFITYSRANYDFIQRNPTLLKGLERCGTLHYVGAENAGNRVKRQIVRIRELVRVAKWILQVPEPILISSRPFSALPADLFYWLAKFRRGIAVLLWKSRSPDKVHHIVWQNREPPPFQKGSILSRLMGRGADAVVYYHPDQMENLLLSERFGRVDAVPRLSIGFPHLFPVWQRLIAEQTEIERHNLEADGSPADPEYYAMFAAKPYSAVNLRAPDAIERVFKQVLQTVCDLRPKAIVLIRPHPLAVDAEYIQEAIDAVGRERARLSFVHPEVLLTLSRRALFNNPTNIMFTCFRAAMIDCSDYGDRHYEEFGEVSLADGYGPVFLNPRRGDFKDRLSELLESDAAFDQPARSSEREKLLSENPADLAPMTDMFRKLLPTYGKA